MTIYGGQNTAVTTFLSELVIFWHQDVEISYNHHFI